MPRFVVVTGTDTGVGKTVVTAGLARALTLAGRRVVAIKPMESGCAPGPAGVEEDGRVLAEATGQAAPREALLRLPEPLTPALAAERAGVAVDLDELARSIVQLGEGADVVLVEGAGGLLSPLSWAEDLTHLAHRLDASVLVVAADRLGTLNHVHLTVQCLGGTGLLPIGIVLSAPATPDASTGTNAAGLRRRLAPFGEVAGRIVELPRVSTADEAAGGLAEVARWIRGSD